MKTITGWMLTSLLGASAAMTALPAHADDSCDQFRWDVAHERSLFAGDALPVAAGKDAKSAPLLTPNHLYQLRLLPQSDVGFVLQPAKKASSLTSHAGIATLKVDAAGSYRVAVDAPFWIDIVASGAFVTADDFIGQRGCSAPHKIVQFTLAAGQPLVLQISGADEDVARLTITAAPARKL